MSAEESDKYIENINMAYKDLSQEVKEQEKKMKNMDPKKAEQLERLGMGFRTTTSVSKGGISHSAFGDMKTIEQSVPKNTSPSFDSYNFSKDMDKKMMLLDLGTGSSFSRKSDPDDDWEKLDFGSSKSSSKPPQIIDTVPSLDMDHGHSFSSKKVSSSSDYSMSSSSNTDEAQKKFGTAKAISSAQYFGNDSGPDFEERSRMNRFQGASSLSSDEYFGRTPANNSSGYSMGGTNLYDIKEGVKEGVTKVAGRLSNLASDVMSSIQDKYGS